MIRLNKICASFQLLLENFDRKLFFQEQASCLHKCYEHGNGARVVEIILTKALCIKDLLHFVWWNIFSLNHLIWTTFFVSMWETDLAFWSPWLRTDRANNLNSKLERAPDLLAAQTSSYKEVHCVYFLWSACLGVERDILTPSAFESRLQRALFPFHCKMAKDFKILNSVRKWVFNI